MSTIQIDQTLPGIGAQIVKSTPARPVGTAGTVAIVGKFERGDANTAYYFESGQEALDTMGSSDAYSGTSSILYSTLQDIEQNNFGASKLICVKAGTTAKATCQLKDGSAANVLLLTAISGGTWANSLTATVSAGTLSSTFKLVIKLSGTVIITLDNCADATEMMNKVNALKSTIVASGTSTELGRTLANVSDSAFATGTETASPTTTDLSNALTVLLKEEYDVLIFTDTPDPAYFATIQTYLRNRLALARGSISVLPLATSTSIAQSRTYAKNLNELLCKVIRKQFTVAGKVLNEAQSAALYAGFIAGTPVNKSTTNKILTNIDAISPELVESDIYALTDVGITEFTLKNREFMKYGVVNAVTTSQKRLDNGGRAPDFYEHAVRTFLFILNNFRLEDWLGATDISHNLDTVQAELDNRKSKIEGLAEEITYTVSRNNEIDNALTIELAVKAHDMISFILYNISLVA